MTGLDSFLVRALLAGLGVAIAAAPLGCFVVWRRQGVKVQAAQASHEPTKRVEIAHPKAASFVAYPNLPHPQWPTRPAQQNQKLSVAG